MTFALTKLLALLAYPLTQALSLLLLALLGWRWRRLSASLCLVAAAWLYLCSTGWFADLLVGTLEDRYPPKALSATPAADAIVVLGGTTRGDTHFGNRADLSGQADRLTHALELYRAGRAPVVLLSGGSGTDGRPEADQMEEYLLLMGMPQRAILKERASTDTHDNAVYSAVILKGRGLHRVLLVTSGFHMPRAVGLFEREGLEVIPAPTDFQRVVSVPAVPRWLPTVDDLQRSTYSIREYVGLIYYRIRGWL